VYVIVQGMVLFKREGDASCAPQEGLNCALHLPLPEEADATPCKINFSFCPILRGMYQYREHFISLWRWSCTCFPLLLRLQGETELHFERDLTSMGALLNSCCLGLEFVGLALMSSTRLCLWKALWRRFQLAQGDYKHLGNCMRG
jgi:hypothetical protein